jgi:50S ribosomal subunit-associated GTPase HflX
MLRLNVNLLNIQLRRFSASRPSRKTIEEAQEKSIKVAIIGLPNSGKSTLINSIMDLRVRLKLQLREQLAKLLFVLGLRNIGQGSHNDRLR